MVLLSSPVVCSTVLLIIPCQLVIYKLRGNLAATEQTSLHSCVLGCAARAISLHTLLLCFLVWVLYNGAASMQNHSKSLNLS